MRKHSKKYIAIGIILCLTAIGVAGATGRGMTGIEVTGYEQDVDYMAEMERCAKDGSKYAMQVGAIYEQQRNLKIQDQGLAYRPTYFFDAEDSETVLEMIQQYIYPKAAGRYDALAIGPEEKDLIARLVFLEARGESLEGQQAVAEVVLNRVLSDRFPDTVAEVIYQEGQFSPAGMLDSVEAGEMQILAVEQALEGENILPLDVVYFSTFPQNDRVWGAIGGHVFCYI